MSRTLDLSLAARQRNDGLTVRPVRGQVFRKCSREVRVRVLTLRGYVVAALAMIVFAAATVWTVGAHAEEPVMKHATGTFEVQVVPAEEEDTASGLGLGRYTLTKTFSGGMTGQGRGQMLTGGNEPTQMGVYVALERFVGQIDGRDGALLFAHKGVMDPSGQSLTIGIVPGSGTGALAGIAGEFHLTIEGGVHRYDLAYTLPDQAAE
jgi:hypothetical protein